MLCFADLNSSLSKDTESNQYGHNAYHQLHNQKQHQGTQDAIYNHLRERDRGMETEEKNKEERR